MATNDYYETLGVARDASPEAVKKAYRGLARKYHPDVNPGDKKAESKFKEVQQAYDILSDVEKRKRYDQFGHAAFEGMGMGAAGHGPGSPEWSARGGPEHFEPVDLSDLIGQFSGDRQGGAGMFEDLINQVRGSRPGRAKTGRPRQVELAIPFLTAVQGGETAIELDHGSGKRENLIVKIPAGIETGAKLRLKGRGEPGPKGAPPGDLTITVKVEPHRYFRREGRDLTVDVPISVAEAILGARIDVPGLDGTKSLRIPPGSSTGLKLRLKGQGVPAAGGKPAGDLFVSLKIVAPPNIDADARRLIQEFADKTPHDPRAGLW